MTHRKIIIPLVLAALLLTACGPASPLPGESTLPPQSTSTPTTQPTTKPTTEPTSEPTSEPTTEPTESVLTFLEPALWLTEPEYLSYEEYFASDPYPRSASWDGNWLVMKGKTGTAYQIRILPGLPGLCITGSDPNSLYRIPNSHQLVSFGILYADGKYAYMRNGQEIIKLELLTGTVTDRLQLTYTYALDSEQINNCTYIIYAYHEGKVIVYRIYLPEMKVDILDSFAVREPFSRAGVSSSREDCVGVTVMNPELLTLLEKEFANPNSKYKKIIFSEYGSEYDFSEIWEEEDPLNSTNPLMDWLYILMFEEYGIPTYWTYHYNYIDGTMTKGTGILCKCKYGTGKNHDHFNPVSPQISEPQLINGDWMPSPGLDMTAPLPAEGKPVAFPEVVCRSFAPNQTALYLYYSDTGTYTEFAPIHTKSILEAEDAIYVITQDNAILQLSYDGSVCNTLYRSQGDLKDPIFWKGSLYIIEDESLIQIDLTKGQYRVILHQEYIHFLHHYNYNPEGEDPMLFFQATAGLSWHIYMYNMNTGTLERYHGFI